MTDDHELRHWPIDEGVEVDLDGPEVIFGDGTRAGFDSDYDCGVLDEATIRPLRLTTLDAALGAIAEDSSDWPSVDTWLIDTDPPDRVYDVEPLDGVVLHTGGQGELCALVDIGLPRYYDEAFEARAPELLEPMMARLDARARAHFHPPEPLFSGDFVVMVEFRDMRGRTVADLLDLALAVQAFLRAVRTGDFNRSIARDLLRAGHTDALVGQPESTWLEVKSQVWNLTTPSGKAEAAKDLSALTNAEGGLVLIPARTTSDAGRDVISEVRALPLERFNETQLRDTLARWTFPPLRGVEIDLVDKGDGRGHLLIHVPRCRPEDWPHLVIGDDSAAFPSAAVAAYIRDGASNRALSAAQLHSLIREASAGRSRPAPPPTEAT